MSKVISTIRGDLIRRRLVWPALALLLAPAASGVRAQVIEDHPKDLQNIDVVEHLGQKIPLDLKFTDDQGKAVKLADYFNHGRPVILNLVYYDCPMLCNLVLNGITEGVRQLPWTPGKEFQMVTISFNPRETYPLAAAKKANYLTDLGKPGAEAGWSFLVGEESQSKALAEAIGFKYFWDSTHQQYAHPAATYILTEDGTISRYLYGIEYSETNLRLSLLEASKGKVGSTIDKFILYCYHYDPSAKGYVVFAGNLMRIGGALTAILIGAFLAVLWRRERSARRQARPVIKGLS
jgi:protein SCO1/2